MYGVAKVVKRGVVLGFLVIDKKGKPVFARDRLTNKLVPEFLTESP